MNPIPPGIYHDLPASTYHADDAVSASRLKAMRRSAAHCLHDLRHPKRSPDLTLGAALHCYALEPGEYAKRYAVRPDFGDLRTKKNKGMKAAWDAVLSTGNLEPIDADDQRLIESVRQAIQAHPAARGLVTAPGANEVSAFWSEGGVPCKCRADRLLDAGTVLDIKSTVDASPDGFQREIMKWGYHIQAGWYLHGLNQVRPQARDFILIAVEKRPPFGVGVYRLDDDAIQQGYTEAMDLFNRFVEARRTGVWPGYGDEIQTIGLPAWALNHGDDLNLTLDGESVKL